MAASPAPAPDTNESIFWPCVRPTTALTMLATVATREQVARVGARSQAGRFPVAVRASRVPMDVRRFAHQHRTAAPRRAEARACRHGVLPASGRCRRSVPARAQQGGGGGGLPFGLGKIFGGGGGGAGANSGAPATEASLTPEARFVMSQGSDDPEFPPFQVRGPCGCAAGHARGCSVPSPDARGSRVLHPQQVVQKTKDYSLRLYSSYPVVEMVRARPAPCARE